MDRDRELCTKAPFLWFGGAPGEKLPSLSKFKGCEAFQSGCDGEEGRTTHGPCCAKIEVRGTSWHRGAIGSFVRPNRACHSMGVNAYLEELAAGVIHKKGDRVLTGRQP